MKLLGRSARVAAWPWLMLLVVGLGCAGEPAPLAGFHLVLVNVDSLRADHLGFHGYPRDTSPALDALAARSVVFDEAISASSITRESVAALLTGCRPSRCGASGWNASPQPDAGHLGERLRDAGYRTGFLSNTVMLRDPGFTRGFEQVQHLPKRWDLSGEGARLSRRALDVFDAAGDTPVALYLHYLDPHAPYDPAPRHLERLGAPKHAEPLALYRDVLPGLERLRRGGFAPGDPRFENLVWRYDAEIAATDEALGLLIEGLEARGLLDRTLLVVTADHGEEFLEHDFFEHGWTLYQESIHVPLLFHAPSRLEPARVASRVSQVDVAPSVARLLGLEPLGDPEGAGSYFDDRGQLRTIARAPIAELWIEQRNQLHAVLDGPWKLLRARRWVAPAQRMAADAGETVGAVARQELFQLAQDPGETRDRGEGADADAEAGRAGARLSALLERRGGSPPPMRAATGTPRVTPEEAERLRALGYH